MAAEKNIKGLADLQWKNDRFPWVPDQLFAFSYDGNLGGFAAYRIKLKALGIDHRITLSEPYIFQRAAKLAEKILLGESLGHDEAEDLYEEGSDGDPPLMDFLSEQNVMVLGAAAISPPAFIGRQSSDREAVFIFLDELEHLSFHEQAQGLIIDSSETKYPMTHAYVCRLT